MDGNQAHKNALEEVFSYAPILLYICITKRLASEGSRRGYNMAEEQAVDSRSHNRSGRSTSKLCGIACSRYSSLTSL
jgi:hypothetical protein